MAVATKAPPSAEPRIEFDRAELRDAIGRAPVRLRHNLAQNPLLTQAAITAVAQDYPKTWSMHHLSDLPLMMPLDQLQSIDADPAEVARGIEKNRSRLTLYYLERLAAYRQLLSACLVEVEQLTAGEGGLGRESGNVFIASPSAVVPLHFDKHHNLLLQVEGSKEVFVGAYTDPTTARAEVNRTFDEGRHNPQVMPAVSMRYELKAGDGLYVPPYLWHWVLGGEGVSIALSAAWSTQRTLDLEQLQIFNAALRGRGLAPHFPGRHPGRDRAKLRVIAAQRGWRRAKNRLKRT